MTTDNTMYKPVTCSFENNCASKGIKCLTCVNFPRESHYTVTIREITQVKNLAGEEINKILAGVLELGSAQKICD